MIGRLLITGTLALSAVCGLAPTAQAATTRADVPQSVLCGVTYECIWTYYNNAQHTTRVGQNVLGCVVDVKWGQTTQYVTYEQLKCG